MVAEIKRQCGWCSKDMGMKAGNWSDPNAVTHGICDECMDRTMPAPFIDEALVNRVQFLGSGRDVHDRAQILQGYISAVEGYADAPTLEERRNLRNIWLKCHTRLRAMLEISRGKRLKRRA